jgi:3-hydroxybutyryl-CoA dehydrogenase/3-hydroxyacyl-CoA dehydrogenase
MGSGIAQSLATGGIETVCTDISSDALARAREQVQTGRFGFERAVQRGKLSHADAEAAFARLTFTGEFDAAANTDIVVECVPERLELKVRTFRDLDAASPEATVLASNSSGFPIAALAAATERPTRVLGWHWASPPVIMRFAEIVVTRETDPEAVTRVEAAARQCGKNPIVVQDAPMAWGYVANRVYFAMIREAQRVVDEGVATPEQVNELMVDCYNWPVGPFAMVKGAGSGWQ